MMFLSFSAFAQSKIEGNNNALGLAYKLDAYLVSATDAYKFNGSALVAKNGEIIFHKAYGWKDAVSKSTNDTATHFPILSITKSFTAVVLLKLVEQGKLSLQDNLTKFLPDYPQGGKIKVEHLLTHSSGIYNYTNDIDEADSAVVNHPVSRQKVLDIFYSKPLEFKPGKGFSYNNSGYYLAGLVIEKATGKSFEQNVRELILEPLDMSNSGFDFQALPAGVKATGYQFLSEKEQKPYAFLHNTVSFSAASIYSTTGDLFKWTEAIAQGKLLSTDTWNEAFTAKNNGYGHGFQMANFGNRNFIKSAGGYPGYVSEIVYYPEEKVTIILLKNVGNYGQSLWPITMGLSNIVFQSPYDLWLPRKDLKLSEEVLRRNEGSYGTNKFRFNFTVQNGQLHTTIGGIGSLRLLAESEDIFLLDDFNTQFRFVKGSDGKVEKLIIHEHGKDFELKKAK